MPSAGPLAESPAGSDQTAAAGLNCLQTVPRQLVHRAAVAEVFLMDALQSARDRFLVAAQWPRDHALYCPDPAGLSDPLLFAETIRQSLVYLAHRFHGVALTHRFVGREVEFHITDPEPLRVGRQPLAPVLEARWTWLTCRPPQRYEMRLEVELVIGGRSCGHGAMHVICLDQRRYDVIRRRSGAAGAGGVGVGGVGGVGGVAGVGGRPESGLQPGDTFTRVAPAEVGRLRAKDSLLEQDETGGRWRMRPDPGHPILFDHPSDHIPMMVALEGFRQVGHVIAHQAPRGGSVGGRPDLRAGPAPATLATAWSLRAVRMECLAFGELDDPVMLEIEQDCPRTAAGQDRVLRIGAVQRGRTIAVATMTWRPDERSGSATA